MYWIDAEINVEFELQAPEEMSLRFRQITYESIREYLCCMLKELLSLSFIEILNNFTVTWIIILSSSWEFVLFLDPWEAAVMALRMGFYVLKVWYVLGYPFLSKYYLIRGINASSFYFAMLLAGWWDAPVFGCVPTLLPAPFRPVGCEFEGFLACIWCILNKKKEIIDVQLKQAVKKKFTSSCVNLLRS